MATANLQIKITAKDEAHAVVKGLGGLFDGFMGGAAKFGLAVGGIKAGFDIVSGGVQGLVGDFMEAQRVSAQTDAVLLSTGGAAGLFKEDIDGLSNALSKVTPFEDELISKTQNMLLTFTNVGKDVFPQATEAALNMATALGESPVDAAMRLGKALNDPIAGVTALRRVGVQLSDAQKKQIEDFMKVGDLASAQKIILQELNVEFGNSARAAGETFAGKLAILQTKFGNVKEVIGEFILGGLTPLLNGFLGFTDLIEEIVAARGINLFEASLEGLAIKIGEVFGPDTQAAFEGFTSMVGDVLGEIVPRLESLAHIAKLAITGDFGGALDGLKDLLVSDVGPGVKAGLQGIGEGVVTWIGEQAPIIGERFMSEWGPAFWEWYTAAWGRMLQSLGGIVTGVMTWITEQGPGFTEKLIGEWVPAFIGWVLGTALPELIKALWNLSIGIGTWIQNDAGPAWQKMSAEIGAAFTRGVMAGIDRMKGELQAKIFELARNLPQWMKDILGIQSPSSVMAKEVGEPIVKGIIVGIEGGIPRIADVVKTIPPELVAAARGIAVESGWDYGKAFDEGVVAGIMGNEAAIGGAVAAAMQNAAKALGKPVWGTGTGGDWGGKLPPGHGQPGAPTSGMWKGGGLFGTPGDVRARQIAGGFPSGPASLQFQLKPAYYGDPGVPGGPSDEGLAGYFTPDGTFLPLYNAQGGISMDRGAGDWLRKNVGSGNWMVSEAGKAEMFGGAPIVNVTVQGNVVGQGGMDELADTISLHLTGAIRNAAALGVGSY